MIFALEESNSNLRPPSRNEMPARLTASLIGPASWKSPKLAGPPLKAVIHAAFRPDGFAPPALACRRAGVEPARAGCATFDRRACWLRE